MYIFVAQCGDEDRVKRYDYDRKVITDVYIVDCNQLIWSKWEITNSTKQV